MDSTVIILLAFAAFCFCMLIYKLISNSNEKSKKTHQIQQAKSQFNSEQTRFLQTVGKLFKENKSMPLTEVYEACGMPSEVANSHNPALIEEHIPFVKGEGAHNVFTTYAMAISNRHSLANHALFEHPNDVLNINLHKGESIYHVIYNVVFYQEKTTVTNVAYSGYKWTSGPLRMGNLNLITNEITRLVPSDAGFLVFTNQRLIFIGKQKNVTKQVKLTDILFCNLYQDGVMVNIPNHKPLIFKFPEHKDWDIYEISDGLNQFAIVYDRLRKGTYKDNLISDNTSSKNNSQTDFTTILTQKNYDTLINDIIKGAIKGETISTSNVQRKFGIGYSRAGKIMDQLEFLGLITSIESGKREWLISSEEKDLLQATFDSANTYSN